MSPKCDQKTGTLVIGDLKLSCFVIAAIKQKFRSADILPGDRVVFNIKGNRYRIVAKITYDTQTVFIRFVGTHAEYDKIDAENI